MPERDLVPGFCPAKRRQMNGTDLLLILPPIQFEQLDLIYFIWTCTIMWTAYGLYLSYLDFFSRSSFRMIVNCLWSDFCCCFGQISANFIGIKCKKIFIRISIRKQTNTLNAPKTSFYFVMHQKYPI